MIKYAQFVKKFLKEELIKYIVQKSVILKVEEWEKKEQKEI